MPGSGDRVTRQGSICEPVAVNPGALVRIERVITHAGDPAPQRFAHFHDAAEFVWLDSIVGELHGEDGRFPLHDGTLVYIPPMRQHDFAIPAGAHRWMLVHIEPLLIERLTRAEPALPQPHCRVVAGDPVLRVRLAGLFEWLGEACGPTGDPGLAAAIVALVLRALGPSPGDTADPGAAPGAIDRLRPALDLIARDPAAAITLGQAAAACHLSPAYFSRLFSRVFGATFSAWLRGYRLRLAAQRLLATGERISAIAFATGFASPAHMTEQFRHHFGMPPGAYRARKGQARDRE